MLTEEVMLHGTIRNDDFKRNTALQCCNHSKLCRNNASNCVALKIVFENRLVCYKHHLNGLKCSFYRSHKFQKFS